MTAEANAVADLFADTWFAEGIGTHLTCGEANTIADWLRSIGRPDAADTLIAGHAPEDDEGDEHNLEQFTHVHPSERPPWVALVTLPTE